MPMQVTTPIRVGVPMKGANTTQEKQENKQPMEY
jgi:hypothetical protein